MKQQAFPDPPEHLSDRSRDLWQTLGPVQASSVERRTLLQTALEALDRADEARRMIQADGLTVTTPGSGALHVHPCLRIERESRMLFAKIWALLGLHHSTEVLPWES